jgi:hypothetical protein
MSASEARRRLEAFRKKQQAAKQQQQQPQQADAGAAPGPNSETEAAAAAAAASVSFEGAISEAFEDSLKYYVAEEQKEVSRGGNCHRSVYQLPTELFVSTSPNDCSTLSSRCRKQLWAEVIRSVLLSSTPSLC